VTTAFVFAAAVMLIAALAFVMPPLLRSGAASPANDVRRRLRALDQARDGGILNDAEYAAKRAELAEALLASADDKKPPARAPLTIALVLALLLPALAIVLYRVVGSPQALDSAMLVAAPESAPADHGGEMDQAIASLVEKLKQNPQDAAGWALLGRAYRETRHFDQARDALKRAHELAPDDADTLAEYVEALALTDPQHRIAGEARTLLDQALKLDPQNQRALWLLGIAHSQDKDYAGAVQIWTRLLPLLPKDSDVAASVKRQIAQAEALRDGRPPPADEEVAANEPAGAGAAGSSTASAAPNADSASAADLRSGARASSATGAAADASGPHIEVTVALDPKLKDKVNANDVLFVFAKAANGPPMPLAIARLTAAQLPATVTLTDGMGMLPAMKLSQFPQVIIGARISKSGNAIAQSGDLQTLSSPIPNTRAEPLALTIDQVVP